MAFDDGANHGHGGIDILGDGDKVMTRGPVDGRQGDPARPTAADPACKFVMKKIYEAIPAT